MAGDVFDPISLRSAQEAISSIRMDASRTAEEMHDIDRAMKEVATTRARMEELRILDPASAADALKMVGEMERKMLALNVPYAKLLAIRKNEKEMITKEVEEMSKLVKASEREEKSQGRIGQLIKGKAKQVGGYVSNMAGVQLSLVGIIALIIEALNITNRISAMSQQISNQWGTGSKHLAGSNKLIWQIRTGFKKSFDEAGQYNKSLAEAGYSYEQLKHISSEMLAIQYAQGQAIGDQVAKTKDLINNYDKTDESSQSFLWAVRQASTEMRGKGGTVMSMAEMVNSTMKLADMTKVYNTDLLGTTALFNTLASKKLADRIGLGKVPLEVRKSIASTITGMSRDLEDGWKAALGKGATVAEKILDFEKMTDPKKFKRMAEFITEQTSKFSGDMKEIATRNLLKEFGFASKESQKVMAEAFIKGGFSGSALEGVMQVIREQRAHLEKLERDAPAQISKLVTQGKQLASNLTSYQDKLKQWVMNNVVSVIKDIRDWLRGTDKKPTTKEIVVTEKAKEAELLHKRTREALPQEEFAKSSEFMRHLRWSDVVDEMMKTNQREAEKYTKAMVSGQTGITARQVFAESEARRFKSVATKDEFGRVLDMIKGSAVQEAIVEMERIIDLHETAGRQIKAPDVVPPYRKVGGKP